MNPSRPTLLALLLGAVAGFALAVSSGVLAGRNAAPARLPPADVQLLEDVMARVHHE